MERLQRNPTIREARTMKDQGNPIKSFRAALTKYHAAQDEGCGAKRPGSNRCATRGRGAGTCRAAREKEKAQKAALTRFQRFKWSVSAFFKRTRERINRMENPLWKGRIKELESHFGGTYVAYFLFVRWLFILNCIISIICIYLVVAMGIADQDWANIEIDFIPYIPSWVCAPRRAARQMPRPPLTTVGGAARPGCWSHSEETSRRSSSWAATSSTC